MAVGGDRAAVAGVVLGDADALPSELLVEPDGGCVLGLRLADRDVTDNGVAVGAVDLDECGCRSREVSAGGSFADHDVVVRLVMALLNGGVVRECGHVGARDEAGGFVGGVVGVDAEVQQAGHGQVGDA